MEILTFSPFLPDFSRARVENSIIIRASKLLIVESRVFGTER